MPKVNSIKNFYYVLINRVLTIGLNGIFWLVMATILVPESFGILSYFVALAGIFSLVSKFGLAQSVVVFHGHQQLRITNSINNLAGITSSIAALILAPINLYAAVACLGFSFFSMNQHNLLGLKKYKPFMWNGLARSLLLLIIPTSLYFVLDIPGILIGLAISDLVCSFYYFRMLNFRKLLFSDVGKNYKIFFHNLAVELSTYLPKTADKLLMVPLFGFVFVGLYQFNLQILLALEALPVALYSFLLSEASSGIEHKKITYLIITSSVLLVLVTFFIGPYFVSELFPSYREGIFSLQILIFSIIPFTISSIINAKLQAQKSTNYKHKNLLKLVSHYWSP